MWRRRERCGYFETGPEAKLVSVRMVRIPAGNAMRGHLWMDEVQLTRGWNCRGSSVCPARTRKSRERPVCPTSFSQPFLLLKHVASGAPPPTLAKNARVGHPSCPELEQRGQKPGPPANPTLANAQGWGTHLGD